eukprot:CAMPEP_0178449024 /NCGR_PEP_ID=MMETSP0689_2-20121128/42313_1 /TAXON_ID=160604 /ORGANISM="Amphidinium massartii, Strain CS-259" /LENGTH=250 /DNA_ID=CAMNT_0020074281 /DNA_START=61 /DNA_END=810 /DNA_ORIENTATION=-
MAYGKQMWTRRSASCRRERREGPTGGVLLSTAAMQRSNLSPAGNVALAVTVRVHGGTTKAMLQRHIAWARSLQLAYGDRLAEFTFLVDDTHSGGDLQALEFGQDSVQVFAYTESDMKQAFPIVAEVQKALPDTAEVRDCFTLPCLKSLAWGFHVEAILLWYLDRRRHCNLKFQHVWIIEDDAAFSGENLGDFMGQYERPAQAGSLSTLQQATGVELDSSMADLIASGFQTVPNGWVWAAAASKAFQKECP